MNFLQFVLYFSFCSREQWAASWTARRNGQIMWIAWAPGCPGALATRCGQPGCPDAQVPGCLALAKRRISMDSRGHYSSIMDDHWENEQYDKASSFSQLDGFKRIRGSSPKGILSSLQVLQSNKSRLFSSKLKKLSLESFGGIPGIYGLDGSFRIQSSENQLDLIVVDPDGISFEFANIFDEDLYFESL